MIEISGYGLALLFMAGGTAFILVTLLAGRALRPNRPNAEKLSTYESGEDAVGTARGNFNIRFYVVAIAFLLFEVELVFLFPWAIVFADDSLNQSTNGLWGQFALIETFVFVTLLALGLVYLWKRGMLSWVKPTIAKSNYQSKIPASAYEHLKRKH